MAYRYSDRPPPPDDMAQLASLYQSINRSIAGLAAGAPSTTAAAASSSARTGSKMTRIRRGPHSFWRVPSYRQVLASLRAGKPLPLQHEFQSTAPATARASRARHRRYRHVQCTPRGGNGSATPGRQDGSNLVTRNRVRASELRKSHRRVSIDIMANVSSSDRGKVQGVAGSARRGRSKPLQVKTAYSKRAGILTMLARELGANYDVVVRLYASLISSIVGSDSSTSADANTSHVSTIIDQNSNMLAHTFLETLGKLISAKSIASGLDEAVFVNFDVEFLGTIDVNEFCLELAACDRVGLTIPQIVSVLFTIYGKADTGSGKVHGEKADGGHFERIISVIKLTDLMNRGRETSRGIIATTERFLSALDADGDGTITWNEFLSAVLDDNSILESFRQAYSVTSRARLLSVMMFSPLNRFVRRCKMNWGMLAKMASQLCMAGERYKIVKTPSRLVDSLLGGEDAAAPSNAARDADGAAADVGTATESPNDNIEGVDGFDHILLEYYQFRDILFPFLGKTKPNDSAIVSDLFDIAAAADGSEDRPEFVNRKGSSVRVADMHRFIIDLSAALEDSAPSMGQHSIKRTQFYFQLLDLDRNGSIDYDEVYEVVSLGQPSSAAKYILHGRKLMRNLRRDADGHVAETDMVEACRKTPELLWQIVQRYHLSSSS